MAREGQVVTEKVERLLLDELRKHLAPMNVVAIRTEQWGEGWETGPSLWVYARFLGEEEKWGGEKYLQLMDVLPSKLEEWGEPRRPVVLFEPIEEGEDAAA